MFSRGCRLAELGVCTALLVPVSSGREETMLASLLHGLCMPQHSCGQGKGEGSTGQRWPSEVNRRHCQKGGASVCLGVGGHLRSSVLETDSSNASV